MIDITRVDASQRALFDRVVREHAEGDPLQLWSWGDLKSEQGWKPYRFLVRDGASGLLGAAQVLERPLPLMGGSILYCPRGPVLPRHRDDAWRTLSETIRQQLPQAVFLKCDPDWPEEETEWGRRLGFRLGRRRGRFEGIQPRHVARLRLEGHSEETLLRSFHPKCRYNIGLASRRGVRIWEGGVDEAALFYTLMEETAARDGFGIRHPSYYAAVLRHFLPDQGKLLFADVGDETVSAGLFLHGGYKVTYLFGASSNRHRDAMPNYLVQWSAIRWALATSAGIYDFLGVPASATSEPAIAGLWRFKSGFSPQVCHFVGELDYPVRPLAYKVWRAADPVAARLMMWAAKAQRWASRRRRAAFSMVGGRTR